MMTFSVKHIGYQNPNDYFSLYKERKQTHMKESRMAFPSLNNLQHYIVSQLYIVQL